MPDIADTEPAGVSEAAVFRKVALRLMPFLFLLYVVNIIDRGNVSIAALQLVKDPTIALLSKEAYAFGAGIFYLGYILFEVPSNLILMRVGARTWIARILVSWGLISTGMLFVTGPWSFCALRVLLGVAEAGFFPGVIYYLTDWFPARARGRCVASFMTGGVFAGMISNALSGAILEFMDHAGGLRGWQWIFLLEGLPAVALGFVTLWYLTDRPAEAAWLTPAEREWLTGEVARDRALAATSRSHSLWAACRDRRVWLLIAVYVSVAMGDNSYGFLLPLFLKTQFSDWSPARIGLLAAAPSVLAIVGMLLNGRHSDRTGERRGHVAVPAFVAVLGWLGMALAPSPWFFVAAAAVATTGIKSLLPTFWTLPPAFLTGAAAAGGIALINSVGNVGGFLGPYLSEALATEEHGYLFGYLVMAGVLLFGGLLVLAVKPGAAKDAA